jgi:hypothetical protein
VLSVKQVKALTAVCALLAISLAMIGTADAAKKHKRPFCSPANSKVLKRTSAVRILYVEHPAGADPYGTPATIYACFPARKKRTKLLELSSTDSWTPNIMALNNRFFAVAATVDDVVCEKYAQPGCVSNYVADFKLANGKLRCSASVQATALALTSNGWIAWLASGGTGQPSTLSACDSAGKRTLDQGTIDAASVLAAGTAVNWTRDGQPQSATLH